MSTHAKQLLFGISGLVGFDVAVWAVWRAVGGSTAVTLSSFFAEALAHPIALYMFVTLLIVMIFFFSVQLPEARRQGMPHLWVYGVLVFTTPFPFALGLFYLMRERHMQKKPEPPQVIPASKALS